MHLHWYVVLELIRCLVSFRIGRSGSARDTGLAGASRWLMRKASVECHKLSTHLLHNLFTTFPYCYMQPAPEGNAPVDYPFKLRGWSGEFLRLIRFSLVGVLSTIVDFGLLMILSGPAQMPVLVANSISYSTGIAISFTLNRAWTFSDAREGTMWSQLVRFLAVSLAALAMNNGIVWLLDTSISPTIGQQQVGLVVAKAVATLVVLGWRFFANSRWTFRRAPVVCSEEQPAPSPMSIE